MKKTNKKGFTIVELVIVIAVIAILAGVLIPTFAGVVRKANESAALQAARNAYTEAMAVTDADLSKLTADQKTAICTETGVASIAYSAATNSADETFTCTYTKGGTTYTVVNTLKVVAEGSKTGWTIS